MTRLCRDSSRSYPGRSVQRAVRVAKGVELRAIPKGVELPSNPKVAVVAMGAGLRAISKGMESPPDPTGTRAARTAATSGVIGQKSAKAIVVGPAQEGRADEGPNSVV
jgi:hypothetical protein